MLKSTSKTHTQRFVQPSNIFADVRLSTNRPTTNRRRWWPRYSKLLNWDHWMRSNNACNCTHPPVVSSNTWTNAIVSRCDVENTWTNAITSRCACRNTQHDVAYAQGCVNLKGVGPSRVKVKGVGPSQPSATSPPFLRQSPFWTNRQKSRWKVSTWIGGWHFWRFVRNGDCRSKSFCKHFLYSQVLYLG